MTQIHLHNLTLPLQYPGASAGTRQSSTSNRLTACVHFCTWQVIVKHMTSQNVEDLLEKLCLAALDSFNVENMSSSRPSFHISSQQLEHF